MDVFILSSYDVVFLAQLSL